MVSSPAAREDDIEAFLRLRVEARDVLRLLFQVAVHDHCPAPPTFCKPGGNRCVLAEVATETNRADRRITRRKCPQLLPCSVGTTVVDENQLVPRADRLESSCDPRVELADAAGAPVDGDDHAELDLRRTLGRWSKLGCRFSPGHCGTGAPPAGDSTRRGS